MKHPGGFTLIEVLVVISIIGILLSIVLVSMSGAREKARDAERRVALEQLSVALNLYRANHISYPASDSEAFAAAVSPLMSDWPTDPSTGAAYGYVSDGQTFKVYATLEGNVAADDEMIPCPSSCASCATSFPTGAVAVYSSGGQCL